MFKFCATNIIRYAFVNVHIILTQRMYQMPLIKLEDVQWGLEQGYKYVHLGLIQFGINPLIRPSLNVSCLACVIDSHHNQFTDALLGVFEAPFHNGLV